MSDERSARRWPTIGIAAALSGAALLPIATAAASPLPTAPAASRAELFTAPAYDQVTFSPDGKSIAMIRPTALVPNLWVAPLDTPDKAVALTHFDNRGIDAYRWTPDGRYILAQKDVAGEEHTQIFAIDVAARRVQPLTANPAVQSKIIRASAKVPGRALIAYNDRDPHYSDVYRVDLATGARELVLRNEQHYTAFVADKDLKLRIAVRVNPEDGSSTYFDLSGPGPRPFLTVPLRELRSSRVLSLTDHGTLRMLYTAGDDLANVVEVDIASGAVTKLARAREADITDVLADSGTGTILATREDPLVGTWTPRTPMVAADFAALGKAVQGPFTIADETPDSRRWLILETSGARPDRYSLWNRDTQTLTFLVSTRPELEKRPLPVTMPITFPSRDGLRITGYLTLPRNLARGANGRRVRPVPLVLDVHGGPWLRDAQGFNPDHVWLAEQGYAALSVNFRGSAGFGSRFMAIADRQWSKTMHDDLIDAVRWTIGQGFTTPDKVAIWGLSYGGYSTLVGLSFTPDTFRCGVDIAGPSDLSTLTDTMPDWWTWQKPQFRIRMGDARTPEGRNDLFSRSPVSRADQVRHPLLVAQGTDDPRIFPEQSEKMVSALAALNRPVTFLLYPDEGHEFEKARTNISFHAIAEHFLAACLGGRAQPYGEDLAGSRVQVKTGASLVPGLETALAGTAQPTSQ